MKTRVSNLKPTITFPAFVHSGSQFLVSAKNCRFLQFIHTTTNNNYHNHLLQTGFLGV